MTGVNITSVSQQTGAIAGRLESSTVITGCYSTGTITVTRPSADDAYVGGIVGNATGGSRVENCYSLCDISTNGAGAGGISGRMEGGSSIVYCYATGSVSGSGSVGGILGRNDASTVKNSVAANSSITTTGSAINRIAGQNSGGTYQNNYANSDMSVNSGTKSDDATINGTGKTLAILKTAAFYTTAGNWNSAAWNFDNVWKIDEGNSLPVFRAIAPTLTAGTVSRTSDTEATIGFTTNKAGTAYYLVVEKDAPAPTSTVVKAANQSFGSVSGAVSGKAVTLSAGAKDIYVVVEGAEENISVPLKIAAAAYITYGIHVNDPNKTTLLTTVAEVNTAIETALETSSVVTVTGDLWGVTEGFYLYIPAGQKVVWQANVSGSVSSSAIIVADGDDGDGVFEVAGASVV
ncbi:hypothetical protein FACS189413_18450 [Bacteroidia bacterium]|nr:hypothetical protein FACS189413_18450 [Bacteroidia bacterium]